MVVRGNHRNEVAGTKEGSVEKRESHCSVASYGVTFRDGAEEEGVMTEENMQNCVEAIVSFMQCEVSVEEAFDLVDHWCEVKKIPSAGIYWELAVDRVYCTLREIAKYG